MYPGYLARPHILQLAGSQPQPHELLLSLGQVPLGRCELRLQRLCRRQALMLVLFSQQPTQKKRGTFQKEDDGRRNREREGVGNLFRELLSISRAVGNEVPVRSDSMCEQIFPPPSMEAPTVQLAAFVLRHDKI